MREAEVKSEKNREKAPQIRAVMFDLDGTLIHSRIDFVKIKRKTIDFYSSLGISADTLSPKMKTYEIIQKATSTLKKKGLTDSECSNIIQDVSRLWNQIEMENVDKTSPVEDARATLQNLKKRNYKIGVITRSCRKYALKALEIAGLLRFVDVIVARGDCVKSKPDPEPLVQGMKLLGSKAEETVMVGDSSIDFQCSKNAGVKFIGILNEKDYLKNLERNGCVTTILSLRDLVDMLT